MAKFILRAENIRFQPPGRGEFLFEDFSMEVGEKEFVALTGPSGCGKTTLLNIFLGYIEPERGTCYYKDVPIAGPNPECLPIYQEDGTWPWLRAVENVSLYSLLIRGKKEATAREADALELMEQVDIDLKMAHRFPKEFSVGMRKRLEIARVLYADPKVIFADEPFGDVDEWTKRDLHRTVERAWKRAKKTVIFSTHDIDEALFLATEIIVLHQCGSKTRMSQKFLNPFCGDDEARWSKANGYHKLYSEIVNAMKGDR